jgi:hypothetical protein
VTPPNGSADELAGLNYWRDHPNPSEAEMVDVCRTWARYQVGKDEGDWWAAEAVMDLDTAPAPFDLYWRVIRCLCAEADKDAEVIGAIGAGPLENFLEREGDRAMDVVEAAATSDRVVLEALAGVWAWDMPVRGRVDEYLAGREAFRKRYRRW